MSTKNLSLSIKQSIHAPASEVFRAFTNSTALREWMCDVATTDPRPGGRIYLYWNSGNYDVGTFSKVVHDKEIEFTTSSNQVPAPIITNVVLSSTGETTTLTLMQSGFPTGEHGEKTVEMMKKIWEKSLKNLISILEEGPDLRITTRPMMGIYLDSFNEKIAKELGVPVKTGTRVNTIVEGFGAQKAGLQKDDIIVDLAGVPQVEFTDYLTAMQGKVGGDVIKVVFYRGAEKKTVDMELSKRKTPEVPPTAIELAEKIQAAQLAVDKELDAVILSASEEAASHRPSEKEWNAKEILAHLLHYERYLQGWIVELYFSQESVADGFGDNLNARVESTVAVYGTLKNVYEEFERNQAEIVELVKRLPDDFVKRKSTWWRMGFNLLSYCDHTREHINQIKAALSAG
jgi:uncharacterized protein YndB with AHSA1/START domain